MHQVVPYAASAGFLAVGLAWVVVRVVRGNAADRRWLAIGAFLVGVGYSLIYCFRTWLVGVDSVLTVQRYHLFPCLGMVLIVTVGLAPMLKRLDARPIAAPAALLALAMALVIVNRPGMSANLGYFRMQPDQGPVLAMMDHLAEAASSRKISRDEVLHAFEPLEPRWTLAGWNALRMLPQTAHASGSPKLGDARVRRELLGSLSAREQAWLMADRNVSPLLERGGDRPIATGSQLVGSLRLHPLDRPEHYLSDGWPSYLEFQFPPGQPSPRALSLPGLPPGKTLELWWSEGDREWTPQDRVVIRVEQSEAAERSDWVLPLDRLPQLEAGKLRRVRITVREPGPVAIGSPALLR